MSVSYGSLDITLDPWRMKTNQIGDGNPTTYIMHYETPRDLQNCHSEIHTKVSAYVCFSLKYNPSF